MRTNLVDFRGLSAIAKMGKRELPANIILSTRVLEEVVIPIFEDIF